MYAFVKNVIIIHTLLVFLVIRISSISISSISRKSSWRQVLVVVEVVEVIIILLLFTGKHLLSIRNDWLTVCHSISSKER